ncbi:hypothetical protein PHMEG_00016122 [Phytophthora megakarya]|uniref:Uncharacterized protein n=1 Tax=Phytophthora megakarya TaxID=4795 RepID=A0A225W0N9_9STRA|nr:hypothetical protein PHMEG_00016122 [Phytophthora megakarya]
MTPSMMATRSALPLTNTATFKYIREKTETVSETTPANVVTSHEPRISTGTKLSRKMKELFSSKERRVKSETPEKKSALYRQFVEARALSDSQLSKATASTPPRDSSSSKFMQKTKMMLVRKGFKKQ